MFGNLTTKPQSGWLDSLVLDINTHAEKQGKDAKHGTGGKAKNFVTKILHREKKNIAEIIEQKQKIDMLLVRTCISQIINKLYANASFNKLGLDFNNGSIFFWLEIKDNDQKNSDKIKEIITESNNKYKPSGLKVHYIVVEEFLGLEIPPDYREIKR